MISFAIRKWLAGSAIAGSIAVVGVVALSSSATAISNPPGAKPQLTDGRRGQHATQASCAGLTRPEQRRAARVIVIGRMLSGPSTRVGHRQILLSPARMRVDRYLKGSGRRTVEVQTGVRLRNGQIQTQEDGILPSVGQRWEILSSSTQLPLQSSDCLGSSRLAQ